MGQTVMTGLLAQIVLKALVGSSWCQTMQMGQAAHADPCALKKGAQVQELDHGAMEGADPRSQLTGPEEFAANLLLSGTTVLLWGQEKGFFNTTQY